MPDILKNPNFAHPFTLHKSRSRVSRLSVWCTLEAMVLYKDLYLQK